MLLRSFFCSILVHTTRHQNLENVVEVKLKLLIKHVHVDTPILSLQLDIMSY